MDELEQFKQFLGPIAKDYTDAQLQQLRGEMHAMAELLLDIHLHRRSRKRAAGKRGFDRNGASGYDSAVTRNRA